MLAIICPKRKFFCFSGLLYSKQPTVANIFNAKTGFETYSSDSEILGYLDPMQIFQNQFLCSEILSEFVVGLKILN